MLVKMGRTGLPVEPCCGPRAGKSRDPRSQNADSSPRAQDALGLGLAAKPKGQCGAPWAPTTCGLGRRMAVDWTWASPLPHAASSTARFDESLHAKMSHDYLRSRRPTVGLLETISTARREPPQSISLRSARFFFLAPPPSFLQWHRSACSQPSQGMTRRICRRSGNGGTQTCLLVA